MIDQLISFETAKLAFSKGCHEHMCKCGGYPDCICKDKRITQSLLQKWLREKHDIHVCIPYLWVYKIFNIKKDDYEDLGNSIIYATYEEAFEAGLQEALKLI